MMASDAAGRALRELATSWLGWFDGDQDDEPPFFPERRSEIADHLRQVRAVLAEREQLVATVERQRADNRDLHRRLLPDAEPAYEYDPDTGECVGDCPVCDADDTTHQPG